jgi:6-phosphogluconolactonase
VSLKTACTSAFDGAMELEYSFPKISSFSLVILGMGADGHTASLFPNTNSLQQGIDLNCSQQFIASMPNDAPHMRISMTASRLLAADEIIIHIVGDKKREVLDKALAATDTSELPVRVILNQTRVPVTVFWSP